MYDREFQSATVTLPAEEYVNKIMNNRPIQINGKKIVVSREIPRIKSLSDVITSGLEVKIQGGSNDHGAINIKNYFRRYGGVIEYHEYVGSDKAYFIFNE